MLGVKMKEVSTGASYTEKRNDLDYNREHLQTCAKHFKLLTQLIETSY